MRFWSRLALFGVSGFTGYLLFALGPHHQGLHSVGLALCMAALMVLGPMAFARLMHWTWLIGLIGGGGFVETLRSFFGRPVYGGLATWLSELGGALFVCLLIILFGAVAAVLVIAEEQQQRFAPATTPVAKDT